MSEGALHQLLADCLCDSLNFLHQLDQRGNILFVRQGHALILADSEVPGTSHRWIDLVLRGNAFCTITPNNMRFQLESYWHAPAGKLH